MSQEINVSQDYDVNTVFNKVFANASSVKESIGEGETESVPKISPRIPEVIAKKVINEEIEVKKEKKQSEEIDWEKKQAILEKSADENRRWGREQASEKKKLERRLIAAEKAILKLKEDGIFDEEAEELLGHLKYEPKDLGDEPIVPGADDFFLRIAPIFDREIENIRKYGNYEKLNDHISAFHNLMLVSPKGEKDDILEEFRELLENEDGVTVTKRMLELGKEYYEDVYRELSTAGSLKSLKAKYEENSREKDKEIERLKKQILKFKEKYEDYDKEAHHGFPQSGTSFDKYGKPGTATGERGEGFNPGKFIEGINTGRIKRSY